MPISKIKSGLIIVICYLFGSVPAAMAEPVTTDEPRINSTAFASEAEKAFRLKDYARAFHDASTAARTGDIWASYLLAVMYERGLGTTANPDEAVLWYARAAQEGISQVDTQLSDLYSRDIGVSKDMDQNIERARRADQAGDPAGSFMHFLALRAGPLSQLDSSGRFDIGKYNALSARPISERVKDVEARDALYRSATSGFPLAQHMLALTLGATLGDNNLKRMLALAGKVSGQESRVLEVYEAVSRREIPIGQSYVSPQLFLDAQSSQLLVGAVLTCGPRRPGATPHAVKLVHISIIHPPEGAVFLPTHEAGYEHAYLIAGKWEESWTYEGCGRKADVVVEFTADGMGSAFVKSLFATVPAAGAMD